MAKSSKVQQLTFFELSQDELNAQKIEKLQESLHKVRKKLFSQHGEILKVVLEMKHEFEMMKQSICRGEK